MWEQTLSSHLKKLSCTFLCLIWERTLSLSLFPYMGTDTFTFCYSSLPPSPRSSNPSLPPTLWKLLKKTLAYVKLSLSGERLYHDCLLITAIDLGSTCSKLTQSNYSKTSLFNLNLLRKIKKDGGWAFSSVQCQTKSKKEASNPFQKKILKISTQLMR